MLIRYKGIYTDRGDAPFVGTLISAISCDHGCKGCINDPIKSQDYQEVDSEILIQRVKDDPFQEGIILAGLEWTLQRDEMMHLINLALSSDLKVILYTYHTKSELQELVPELYKCKGVYVKYGEYREDLRVEGYYSYGVRLATSNQYIEII